MDDPVLRLSFGNVAETYDRVRPPYSQELLDRAQAALALGADARVLDLAAGTGRLTSELTRRFAQVVAVEPNDAMRALICTPGTILVIGVRLSASGAMVLRSVCGVNAPAGRPANAAVPCESVTASVRVPSGAV